jgi:hypothetical protein
MVSGDNSVIRHRFGHGADESHPSDHTRLYAQLMGQGDLPAPRGGGPFRRRREKRQLEQLVQASKEHIAPTPSATHVKVVEDQAEIVVEGQAEVGKPELETSESGSATDSAPRSLTGGFHVRPVPIDEPIND